MGFQLPSLNAKLMYLYPALSNSMAIHYFCTKQSSQKHAICFNGPIKVMPLLLYTKLKCSLHCLVFTCNGTLKCKAKLILV